MNLALGAQTEVHEFGRKKRKKHCGSCLLYCLLPCLCIFYCYYDFGFFHISHSWHFGIIRESLDHYRTCLKYEEHEKGPQNKDLKNMKHFRDGRTCLFPAMDSDC